MNRIEMIMEDHVRPTSNIHFISLIGHIQFESCILNMGRCVESGVLD